MAHQIMPPDTWVKANDWACLPVEVRWDSHAERVQVRVAGTEQVLVLTFTQWLQLRTSNFMTGGPIDGGNPWADLIQGSHSHNCYQGHCPAWPDDVAAAATLDAD